MHRRGVRVGCLVGVLVLSLAGCGNSGGRHETAASRGQPAVETTTVFPVTIKNCGRTLTFEKRPSKVVAGDQSVLETLIELQVQNRILGRTRFDENIGAPDQFLPGHKTVYDGIPGISRDAFLPKKEALLALRADFVLDVSPRSFAAETGHATVDELAAAGAQVFIAGNRCTETDRTEFRLENTLDDIMNLGRIFGVEDRAAEMVDDLRHRMDAVSRSVADEKPLRVVFADRTGDSLSALGPGLANAIAEAAGVHNALRGAADCGKASMEEVARANADAYVVIQHLPTTAEQCIAAIEKMAPDSPGVRSQRYVVIPAIAVHPGYRTFVAVETIARALYPDAFKESSVASTDA
jgi:iron complex transport system substrate-binding protein